MNKFSVLSKEQGQSFKLNFKFVEVHQGTNKGDLRKDSHQAGKCYKMISYEFRSHQSTVRKIVRAGGIVVRACFAANGPGKACHD